jgi:mannosyltransferase
MEQRNKTYGFVISMTELPETVPNLFRYVTAYKRKLALKSRGLWEMFLDQPYFNESQDIENVPDGRWGQADVSDAEPDGMEGETYNRCHFLSNFEIARLGFFQKSGVRRVV